MSQEREQARIEQEREDVRRVMDTDSGRRFMWRLIGFCGVYRDIDCSDNTVMGKQVGVRKVGLYLLDLITDADEEGLFRMMKEAKLRAEEEAREYEAEREQADANDGGGGIRSVQSSIIDTIV